MTSPIPLDPEQAALARNVRPLTRQEKRNLLSSRQNEPSGTRQAAPEPDGGRIASLLVRLQVWLAENGIDLTDGARQRIAEAENPWQVLRQFVRQDDKFELVESTIRNLHEEEWRVGFVYDSGRLGTGRAALPGGGPTPDDDGHQYAKEWNRLVHQEGLTSFQAHRLLKEWGFLNPFIPVNDRDQDLESLAEGLAIMRATGEYTGDIEPADLLVRGTVVSALQLLEESGYEGSLGSFEQFEETLVTVTGAGETIDESQRAAEEAEFGRPVFEDEGDEVGDRKPIGVSPDFVARAAPRATGRLRGTRNRPGLDAGDARALAESGPAGASAVAEAQLGIEQPPEYFEGDNYNIFNGLSFEQTMLYQTMLVDAGWLDPDDFKMEQGQQNGGFATWAAMSDAMTAANRTVAATWIEAAQLSAAAREANDAESNGDEPVPVWTPGVYLAPDPDFLSQVVKTTFRNQLGREPSASEVRALASSLSGEFRGVFDVEEEQALAIFEQGLAARDASLGPIDPDTGERVVDPLSEDETFRTVEPGIESLTGIDPIASFQERFEARFAEELARGRQREVNRDSRRDIMGSIFATDAAVGGGR